MHESTAFVNESGKKEYYAALAPLIGAFIEGKQKAVADGHHIAVYNNFHLEPYSFEANVQQTIRALERRSSAKPYNPLPDFTACVINSFQADWNRVMTLDVDVPHSAFARARLLFERDGPAINEAYRTYTQYPEEGYLTGIETAPRGFNTGIVTVVYGLWSRNLNNARPAEQVSRLLAQTHIDGIDALLKDLGINPSRTRGDFEMKDVPEFFGVKNSVRYLAAYGRGLAVGCPVLLSKSYDGTHSTKVLHGLVEDAFEKQVIPHLHTYREHLDQGFIEGANELVRAAIEGRPWTKPSKCPVTRLKALVTRRAQ